ncbi:MULTISPECIES: tol-pal system protein YbgF [Thalassobaculum]|uniref:Cell division coordinator CpoB n=1 Tax=Thalassobaculum litoreum DSM 18839 TaxID=1123362 RepID=A0A8G2BEQ6_9PROT|nr:MULTISPECIES: tol-pal system protein YbgF [Thalassobaculum]SDF24135.1 tol-pal system protein YbgF [Thalassobaculum litoreum DSM 18839]
MMRFVVLILLLSAAVPTVASAQQDVSGLLNRMARLERELADLQRSVYAGGQPPASVTANQTTQLSQPDGVGGSPLARIEIRLQQIEADLRRVTGRVEELGYQVQNVSDRMDRMQTDTDIRFRELSGDAGAASGQQDATGQTGPRTEATPPATTGGSTTGPTTGAKPQDLGTLTGNDLSTLKATTPPPSDTAATQTALLPADASVEDQYKAAFDHLVKHDLPTAEAAFKAFLEAHPDDPLAGNAQYWLGETYYARERYEEAAVAFLGGYQSYPKSPKAADNLLKLGMALARIDRKEEACTTFAKLNEDFPKAPTNIKRRMINETKALNCGG